MVDIMLKRLHPSCKTNSTGITPNISFTLAHKDCVLYYSYVTFSLKIKTLNQTFTINSHDFRKENNPKLTNC